MLQISYVFIDTFEFLATLEILTFMCVIGGHITNNYEFNLKHTRNSNE